jgi:hypothetical protein
MSDELKGIRVGVGDLQAELAEAKRARDAWRTLLERSAKIFAGFATRMAEARQVTSPAANPAAFGGGPQPLGSEVLATHEKKPS